MKNIKRKGMLNYFISTLLYSAKINENKFKKKIKEIINKGEKDELRIYIRNANNNEKKIIRNIIKGKIISLEKELKELKEKGLKIDNLKKKIEKIKRLLRKI